MTTVTATSTALERLRAQTGSLEGDIARHKAELAAAERELGALKAQHGTVATAKLADVVTRMNVQEEIIRRLAEVIRPIEAELADVWRSVRQEEKAERLNARMAEAEKLKAETLRAIAAFRDGIAALKPQVSEIQNGRRGLQRIIDSVHAGQYPLPPEALSAQAAVREIHDALRLVRGELDWLMN
jgi:chromosome segregation ATPase